MFISVVVGWKFFVGKFLNWHCLVKFGIMESPFCRFYALWRGQFFLKVQIEFILSGIFVHEICNFGA